MNRSSVIALCVAGAAIFATVQSHGDQFRAPLLMQQAPKLDGRIGGGEWAVSAGFDGFGMKGNLQRRKVRARVAATDSHLYFAVKSQLPAEGKLLSQVDLNTVKIVHDDSIEVWIDPKPDSEHSRIFQMLTNPIGRIGYKAHARGNVKEAPGWEGNWNVANGFHDGWWHCEIAVPIADIAPRRDVDDGRWGINICRNWKQPWQFSSLGGGAYMPTDSTFTFATGAPAIAHKVRQDPFIGDIDMQLSVYNPTEEPLSMKALMEITRDAMPALRREKKLTVPAKERKAIGLKADDGATKRFDLRIGVTDLSGETTYYAREYKWERGELWNWTTETEKPPPIDFQYAYYPYLNTLRVMADITNLPADAELEKLSCVIREKGAEDAIETGVFKKFVDGRREKQFQLPPLKDEYEIAVTPHGSGVPDAELVKEFERTVYPWEHAGRGKTDTVHAPFEPLEVEDNRVSVVLREHRMNELGLWDQVVAKGEPILAAPMELAAEIDGQEVELRGTQPRFEGVKQTGASAHTQISADGFAAGVDCKWDYDGCMRVDMQLQPAPEHTIDALTLRIPLDASKQLLYHAMGDGIRNTLYDGVPAGEGIVWTSKKVQTVEFPANFCTYIYVGTPNRGLCWFAENDRGWSWKRGTPNVDIVREGDTATLRVHLVNDPITIRDARKITFGLLAAPVKPRLGNWRYKWHRDRYTLLGTDINWFALGHCGAVYPAHKDMYLWRMLARSNKQKLSGEQIQEVLEHGRKYWEPYGEKAVEKYERHVRYNLRARRNKKMVLYYNRASYQRCEEFQTFKDEWSLTNYRTVGEGDGIGEIKIVPTDSYIDYALYWYGKAFDIANSKGVYWDNYFFRASYNRTMQSAYRRDDGSAMPSTGLWGLRRLAKRTFQYMNERDMKPITMAHMTSTGILPLLSFCTVQYDWEWKYSRGDVQYRFPREYILLVSNGQLAGTWPVLLRDHGRLARDPHTQRTFAAVCPVHELDGWGLDKVWKPLFDPIHEMVEADNLEVYRYWDEQAQPVRAASEKLPGIVYCIPGEKTIFAMTSYAEKKMQAEISIDPVRLGFDGPYRVIDVISGRQIPVQEDTMTVPIQKHGVREFRIVPEDDAR